MSVPNCRGKFFAVLDRLSVKRNAYLKAVERAGPAFTSRKYVFRIPRSCARRAPSFRSSNPMARGRDSTPRTAMRHKGAHFQQVGFES